MSSGITITSASADVSERDMEVEDEAEVDGTSKTSDEDLPQILFEKIPQYLWEELNPAVELVTVLAAVLSTLLIWKSV